MEKPNQPISIQQLIEQYQQELMQFKDVHTATQTQEEALTVAAHLDEQYPIPNVEKDLQQLKDDTKISDKQPE